MTMRRQMALVVLSLSALTASVAAQPQQDPQKERPRTTTTSTPQKDKKVTKDRLEPDDTTQTPSDVSQDIQANRQQQVLEDAAVNGYYNNFSSTYHLRPAHVIS